MNRLTLTVALLLYASSNLAQQQLPVVDEPALAGPPSAAELLDEIERQTSELSAGTGAYSAEETREYNSWALDYKKKAYLWHQVSTIIIFVVVVFVVLAGVILAAWQLRAWINRVNRYDKVLINLLDKGNSIDGGLVEALGQPASGTIDLKSNALAVSSPYVGVLILGLSMGFFLAYLLLVYPVTTGP